MTLRYIGVAAGAGSAGSLATLPARIDPFMAMVIVISAMLITAYVVLATSPTRQLRKHVKALKNSDLSPEQQTKVLVAQAKAASRHYEPPAPVVPPHISP